MTRTRLPVMPALQPLNEAFAALGAPVYAVGGLVRNALLGLPPSDIDVCSRLTPQELLTGLRGSGIRAVGKSLSLGTLTLTLGDITIEHTTFRSESYQKGGTHRPDAVLFSDSLEADAFRRDFSVNALYQSLSSGEVLDPTGGLSDIENRILRTTSQNPDDILRSDALRVLRLVRFACQLGFDIDERTFLAAKQHAMGLLEVSAERRRDEFSKLLLCDARYPTLPRAALRTPVRALTLVDELNLWDALIPAFKDARGIEQRPDFHRYDVLKHSIHACAEAPCDETLRLAALLHDVGKPACFRADGTFRRHESVGAALAFNALTDLRYPKRIARCVSELVRLHMFDLNNDAKPDTLRLRFAMLGREQTSRLIALREADFRGCGLDTGYVATRWRETFQTMLTDNTPFSPDELALSGTDIMRETGLDGAAVGRVKTALWRLCVKKPARNTRDRLLGTLRSGTPETDRP